MSLHHPQRVVCLTPETTDVLYLLGEQERIVGISGYTVRPKQARAEKPHVSAFTTAKIDRIVDLKPDLVLAFSGHQGSIVEALVKQGLEVHVFNQRSVQGIFTMILTLGSLVGAHQKALDLVQALRDHVERERVQAEKRNVHPVVYFEEWDDPLMFGVEWVSELVEIAGAIDCFADRAREPGPAVRSTTDAEEVIAKRPDIIIGSWCGRKFRPEAVCRRPGWDQIPAIRNGHVYEIKSAYILQPGPVALTEGLTQLCNIIRRWSVARSQVPDGPHRS